MAANRRKIVNIILGLFRNRISFIDVIEISSSACRSMESPFVMLFARYSQINIITLLLKVNRLYIKK